MVSQLGSGAKLYFSDNNGKITMKLK